MERGDGGEGYEGEKPGVGKREREREGKGEVDTSIHGVAERGTQTSEDMQRRRKGRVVHVRKKTE